MFVFSHVPPNASGLRVLQENHGAPIAAQTSQASSVRGQKRRAGASFLCRSYDRQCRKCCWGQRNQFTPTHNSHQHPYFGAFDAANGGNAVDAARAAPSPTNNNHHRCAENCARRPRRGPERGERPQRGELQGGCPRPGVRRAPPFDLKACCMGVAPPWPSSPRSAPRCVCRALSRFANRRGGGAVVLARVVVRRRWQGRRGTSRVSSGVCGAVHGSDIQVKACGICSPLPLVQRV